MHGVITAVGNEPAGRTCGLYQRPCQPYVIGIAGGKQQNAWPSEIIGRAMKLAGPAAPRAAYALDEGPPFPPAAERCAFTCVASIETIPCGP